MEFYVANDSVASGLMDSFQDLQQIFAALSCSRVSISNDSVPQTVKTTIIVSKQKICSK